MLNQTPTEREKSEQDSIQNNKTHDGDGKDLSPNIR